MYIVPGPPIFCSDIGPGPVIDLRHRSRQDTWEEQRNGQVSLYRIKMKMKLWIEWTAAKTALSHSRKFLDCIMLVPFVRQPV
jgi:hypothetical protein